MDAWRREGSDSGKENGRSEGRRRSSRGFECLTRWMVVVVVVVVVNLLFLGCLLLFGWRVFNSNADI